MELTEDQVVRIMQVISGAMVLGGMILVAIMIFG